MQRQSLIDAHDDTGCIGDDQAILEARHALYMQARDAHPARWSGNTRNWSHIGEVTLNQERDAVVQIIVADVSMSLDNVLAVAGAAHDHPEILIFGLALSVLLMGVAATFIARLLHKHRWIAYVGLIIILYVAIKMMWDGGLNIRDCNPTWFGMGTEIGVGCPLHADFKPH